ncbi:hypothetical protein OXX59_002048 [Metschnikowia pulcherrima]
MVLQAWTAPMLASNVVVSTPAADITETDLSATNVEKERMSSVHKMVADTSHVASPSDTPGSIEQDDDHGRDIISTMDVFEDLLSLSDSDGNSNHVF